MCSPLNIFYYRTLNLLFRDDVFFYVIEIWSRTNEWHIPSAVTNYLLLTLAATHVVICTRFYHGTLYCNSYHYLTKHYTRIKTEICIFFKLINNNNEPFRVLTIFITRLLNNTAVIKIYYDLGRSVIAGVVHFRFRDSLRTVTGTHIQMT